MLSYKIKSYCQLMRLNKPIGVLLLLWPTLWGLWIAAHGLPHLKILSIFVLGVIIMRCAGCVINDFADRNFDGHVTRTNTRPLVTGAVSSKEAILLFITLCTIAFLLVLLLNKLTILLAIPAVIWAASYPFMKRVTNMPQAVLGIAFSWGIPMAFAAVNGVVPSVAWILMTANILWTIAYDTQYAMVDRDDDLNAGIKSSAILFGKYDRLIIALLQLATLLLIACVGILRHFNGVFYILIGCAALLFIYQHILIKKRVREKCFCAFLNNNWVGFIFFIAIAIQFLRKT